MGSRPPLKIQAASAPPSKTTFGENSTKSQWKNSGASPKCLNNDAAFFGAVGLGSGPKFPTRRGGRAAAAPIWEGLLSLPHFAVHLPV